jgi:hypothetical protein
MNTKISQKKENVIKLRNKYSQDITFTSDNYPLKIIDGKSFIAIFSDLKNRRISYMNRDAFEIVK